MKGNSVKKEKTYFCSGYQDVDGGFNREKSKALAPGKRQRRHADRGKQKKSSRKGAFFILKDGVTCRCNVHA